MILEEEDRRIDAAHAGRGSRYTLVGVVRAAAKVTAAQTHLRLAMCEAHKNGASLRGIAEVQRGAGQREGDAGVPAEQAVDLQQLAPRRRPVARGDGRLGGAVVIAPGRVGLGEQRRGDAEQRHQREGAEFVRHVR